MGITISSSSSEVLIPVIHTFPLSRGVKGRPRWSWPQHTYPTSQSDSPRSS